MNPKLLPVLRRIAAALGPFLALIALLIVFRFACGGNFWGWVNLQNILTQTVIVAVGAVGMTVIIVGGGIDLSCGSCIALAAVMASRVLATPEALGDDPSRHQLFWHWLSDWPDWLAVFMAIGIGALVGLANGGLIAGLRQLPFIATLGMMGIVRGVAKWQADNQNVPYDVEWLPRLMYNPKPPGSTPFGHDAPVWLPAAPSVLITLVLATVMWLLMRFGTFGRKVYALGSNEAAARLCGIHTGWTKIAVYVLGGACFGLAGLFAAARLNLGDPITAMGLELDIIAAVIVGGASLSGGTGTVAGSLIGAVIMTVLRNGAQQLGWPSYVQEILIGAAIVIAVALDRLRTRRA